MKRIILNIWHKPTGTQNTPIFIDVCEFATPKDALAYAKFKAKSFSKEYDITITKI